MSRVTNLGGVDDDVDSGGDAEQKVRDLQPVSNSREFINDVCKGISMVNLEMKL